MDAQNDSRLFDDTTISLMVASNNKIGASVFQRIARNSMEDQQKYSFTLFDFLDNEQYSNLDSFLVQYNSGCITLLLSEDLNIVNNENNSNVKHLAKKIDAMLLSRRNQGLIDVQYVKRNAFISSNSNKFGRVRESLLQLVHGCHGTTPTHSINVAETQAPLAYTCTDVLINHLKLCDNTSSAEYSDRCAFNIGSLETYMRIDSAAAEAVNLLPKADHPSQFGSIYGVLNRCKSKMGSRVLERWLRQPLINKKDINDRLDIVELLKENTTTRSTLQTGPLKGMHDVDAVISKISRSASGDSGSKAAGLTEVFRLYMFTRSATSITEVLGDLLKEDNNQKIHPDNSVEYSGELAAQKQTLHDKIYAPLLAICSKFQMYQQLAEHVIDFDQLPDLVVNSNHNPKLRELHEEKQSLVRDAQQELSKAQHGYASFADVKLESNNQYAYFMRTTKGDDERQLRANSSKVRVLSLQKNGVHFTTDNLESISARVADIDREYQQQQKAIVIKAVETASTYMPIAEAASALVAEIDVLTGFAMAAALSSTEYTRPKFVDASTNGKIIMREARHPCVELMDSVSNFIANDYELEKNKSNFQLVTGPNMGGKSTYIRGIGSIVVMAQVGSFVPCAYCELSPVDCILARVGAGDAVQKGISTFMAEMLEASVILQTATSNSLIIIDELGRGTSTFDGFGIAWAISEYIVKHLGCYSLFATHFHELTALSRKFDNVVNKHVHALVQGDVGKEEVIMLYNVQDGACNESFGIHIANTAGFPPSVIKEAKRKASELERVNADEFTEAGTKKLKVSKEMIKGFFSEHENALNLTSATTEVTPDMQTVKTDLMKFT
jgi:DNA mismatch repair protein MSH2